MKKEKDLDIEESIEKRSEYNKKYIGFFSIIVILVIIFILLYNLDVEFIENIKNKIKKNVSEESNGGVEKETEDQKKDREKDLEKLKNVKIGEYTEGEFQLDFSEKYIRTPEERIYVKDSEVNSEDKVEKYIEEIDKTRDELRDYKIRVGDSDSLFSIEPEDSIGLNSHKFPILSGSNVKAIALEIQINEDSISVIPTLDYVDNKINDSIGKALGISAGNTRNILVAKLTWEPIVDNNELSHKQVRNISFYIETDIEDEDEILNSYFTDIKIDFINTTIIDKNISFADLRIYAEFRSEEIIVPENKILLESEEELINSLEDENPIIFIGSKWLVERTDNSCEGIKFPGVENIGVADYISSRLIKSIKDELYPIKEGVPCPFKVANVDSDRPKASLILDI
jgi:hypothetical protein